MAKFKIGDRVRIANTDKTGVVKKVIDDIDVFCFWGDPTDYVITLDDEDGQLTCDEGALEAYEFLLPRGSKRCECGAASVGVNKHANWCELFDEGQ